MCCKRRCSMVLRLIFSLFRLPQLVWRCRLVLERIAGFYHRERRAGDQVMGFQKPINTGFRDEVRPFIGERHGQFSTAQLWPLQRQVENLLTLLIGNPVPGATRPGTLVCKASLTKPLIECKIACNIGSDSLLVQVFLCIQAALTRRAWRRSRLARPYIWRFTSLSFVI